MKISFAGSQLITKSGKRHIKFAAHRLNVTMFLDQYEYYAKNNFLTYQFTSQGSRGAIEKIVQYSRASRPDIGIVYNLGFGDLMPNNQLDDSANSNNGDMNKVFATVASTVYDFFAHYPGETIYAKGSTPLRTRVYQRKLRQMIDIIEMEFNILGLGNKGWTKFTTADDYDAFFIKKKYFNYI